MILRRVDGWFCDPLELRPDSQLGVPGLLEIGARRRRLDRQTRSARACSRAPALMAFLPALGQHLLGREPELRAAPMWWCGDERARRHVLANLEQLVLRPTSGDASGGDGALLGWELSSEELDDLRRRIEHAPGRWVGQERVAMSSVPVLGDDGGLDSRRSVLRTSRSRGATPTW